MTLRDGEQTSAPHFRANRFYQIGDQWFFSTREKLQVGPFKSRDEAEIELALFLKHLREGGYAAEAYIAVAHY